MLKAPDFIDHAGGFPVGSMEERRDTGRGPDEAAARLGLLDLFGSACSGSELETIVPAPTRLSKYPSARSWA
jgi:hypothetical protein